MYTEADWSKHQQMQNELDTFGEKYINEFYHGGRGNYFFEQATIDGDMISIKYEWSCMGGHEMEYDSVPLSYLWTDNWIELEKERREEQRIAREKAENQAKIDRRNKEIEAERQKYLELKEKYGE